MTHSSTNAVSIEDIFQRQVQLEWYEAVALIAELCAVLSGSDGDAPVPPPEDVLVRADGTITIHDPGARDESVVALPRMLNGLLAGSAPPAPLRLFVLHAISAGSHKTAKTFGEALAYYERPGRPELIQAVYQRYLNTSASGPQAARPLLASEEDKPVLPKRSQRNIRPWVAAAVMLLSVTAGIAVWASTNGVPVTNVANVANVARSSAGVKAIVARVGEAARSFTNTVREELGLGAAATDTSEEPKKIAEVKRQRRRSEPPAETDQPAVISDEAAAATVAERTIAETAEPSADFATEVEPLASAISVPNLPVYSNTSTEVQPPVLLDPHRPPPSVRVANESVANAMELIITDEGNVERVRMLSPPLRMPDMMLLSAAKNWKFEPALRDGQPVRYRLTFDWVTRLR